MKKRIRMKTLIQKFVMKLLLALVLVGGSGLPSVGISHVDRYTPYETPYHLESRQSLTQSKADTVQPFLHKQEDQGECCCWCPDSDVVTNEFHAQQEN